LLRCRRCFRNQVAVVAAPGWLSLRGGAARQVLRRQLREVREHAAPLSDQRIVHPAPPLSRERFWLQSAKLFLITCRLLAYAACLLRSSTAVLTRL